MFCFWGKGGREAGGDRRLSAGGSAAVSTSPVLIGEAQDAVAVEAAVLDEAVVSVGLDGMSGARGWAWRARSE